VRFATVRATGEEGSSAVGLGVVFSFQETSWRVESVIAGGPAEAAGVRPGDLVEAINGRAIAALGCDERRELRDAGQVLTLLLRREGESLLLAVKMATLVP
jgi:C-terminal processing protease CtpA/Prc